MARKKGTATPRGGRGGRGGGRGGRGGRPTHRGHSHIDLQRTHGTSFSFTLADEARQTSQRDHTFWSSSNNLRSKPVSFISAGTSEPLKQLDDLIRRSSHDEAQPSEATGETIDESCSPAKQHELQSPRSSSVAQEPQTTANAQQDLSIPCLEESKDSKDPAEEALFVIDVVGGPVEAPPTEPTPDPEQLSESTSDEEVILFKGRNPRQRQPENTYISLTQMRTEIQVVENEMSESTTKLQVGRKRKPKKAKRPSLRSENDEEDALIADYIANMRENGEADDFLLQATYNGRDLGGSDADVVLEASSDSSDNPSDGASDSDEPQEDVVAPLDDMYQSESELDDETLAKLLAGHEPGSDLAAAFDINGLESSDSDSSEDLQERKYPDELDLMDWERPSLRRKRKGARAQISFGMSDSEMEQTLQVAWKNDRLKKSQRKRQREELRALGLLGQSKPGDLRVKYPQGMSLNEVSEEMRLFLQAGQETLTLPPMDTHARKMIHELANKFNIKSKSTGKADQRRPTLYRTLGTLPYSETTFDQAVSRINRRYFPRQDLKGKAKRGQRPPPARGNHAEATYRDGEVVGAAAPELGVENRGRAMLEKMGWSRGTALGATHNKGILLPVTHTMKRSKAGLA